MTEQEKYRLSVYQTVRLLRKTQTTVVEEVESELDGKRYIKKTYPSDKRDVFFALADLRHPNLPQIREVFFGEDTIVIEEQIPGKTLEDCLAETPGRLEPEKIFRGLLSAVEKLHENHVIHRDIKPSNVIVTPWGEPVLIDFSIARIHNRQVESDTQLLGTVGYAAPEQFGFSQSDERTDIYAIGRTMEQVIEKIATSRGIRAAVAKCTEFDPARRFFSAQAVVAFLKQKRRRKKWMFAGGILLFAVVCLLCSLHFANMPPEELPTPAETVQTPPMEAQIPIRAEQAASSLIEEPLTDRIVVVSECQEPIPCLPLPESGRYTVSVALREDLPETEITVEREEDACRVTVGGETFSFADDHSLSTADYPSGTNHMEVVFYDLNTDGMLDVIPVICHGSKVVWADGYHALLRNYTLAWCIFYDGETFRCDETRMVSELEALRIYGKDGCIWTDLPAYYHFVDGKLREESF